MVSIVWINLGQQGVTVFKINHAMCIISTSSLQPDSGFFMLCIAIKSHKYELGIEFKI